MQRSQLRALTRMAKSQLTLHWPQLKTRPGQIWERLPGLERNSGWEGPLAQTSGAHCLCAPPVLWWAYWY